MSQHSAGIDGIFGFLCFHWCTVGGAVKHLLKKYPMSGLKHDKEEVEISNRICKQMHM